MEAKPEISVIIPSINEGKNLQEILPELQSVLKSITPRFEIIIVDCGSDDRAEETAAAEGVTFLKQTSKGYGTALKEGLRTAKGNAILTLDADFTHHPVFIRKMWQCRDEAAIIVASRYTHGSITVMPRVRHLLSFLLNAVYRKALSLPVRDLSSGFRLYKSDIFREINLQSENFDILEEILIKTYISGFTIKEIPFIYNPRRKGRPAGMYARFLVSFLMTLYHMWKLRNTIEACDYDERAYNSPVFFQRYWQRRRHNIIVHHAYALNSVLDIGCGSSRILNTLPNAVGMDIDIKKMRHMQQFETPVLCASAFQLPFKSGTFDGVVCSEVIEHIRKDDSLFKEIARVLKPGSTLILGTPDYSSNIWMIVEALYKKLAPGGYGDEHISHYTRHEMISLAERFGFQFQKIEYICRSEMIAVFIKSQSGKNAS